MRIIDEDIGNYYLTQKKLKKYQGYQYYYYHPVLS